MKTVIRPFSPQECAEILEKRNPGNRPMSRGRVCQYAADMVAGLWRTTHQGVAFDEDGNLLDGQHRLAAIVMAGVIVELMVTTGIPRKIAGHLIEDVMDTIDSGQPRSTGQQLLVSHGLKNANRVAACVKVIASICSGNSGRPMSTPQSLKVLEMYRGGVDFVLSCSWQMCARRSPLLGTLSFAYYSNRDGTVRFAEMLSSMANIPDDSPVMALNRWNDAHGQNAGSSNRLKFQAVTASALIKFYKGQSSKKLQQNDDALVELVKMQKEKVDAVCKLVNLNKS